MFATLGALGKAFLPQLLTIGSKALMSSPVGGTIKKFLSTGVGSTLASAAASTFNNLVGDSSQEETEPLNDDD